MGEPEQQVTEEAQKRVRSQIEFPYADLERSEEMARLLSQIAGRSKIEQTQLAVEMNQTASGGTFRGRLGAARMFGLIETDQGEVWLSGRGHDLVNPESAAAARLEAFLSVPLYKVMFDNYQGYALPPAAAIERQMEQYGVPPKQKERARQVFQASAAHAGFIAANGKFSKPIIHAARAKEEIPADLGGGGSGGNSGGGDAGSVGGATNNGGEGAGFVAKHNQKALHPFIVGLLETLPAPQSEWSAEERANWLQTAASIFTLIYKDKGTGTVSVNHVPKENEPPKGGSETGGA